MVAVLTVGNSRGRHTYNTTCVDSLRRLGIQDQCDSYDSLLCQVSLPLPLGVFDLLLYLMQAQSELTPFPSHQIMLGNNEVMLPQLPSGHFSLPLITGAQLAY